MASKEDLKALAEIGRLIPNEDKRQQHLKILLSIAERMGVFIMEDLQGSEREKKENGVEEIKTEIRKEKSNEEQKKIQVDRSEQEKANEEKGKMLAEQRKKPESNDSWRKEKEEQVARSAKETLEREAKEREEKETRLKRASTYRRSTVSTVGKLNTGNSLEEVQARIPKPDPRGADLTEPSIAKVYANVRDDNNPTNWMMLRYEGQTNKLKTTESGSGGFEEFCKYIVEEPLYGYFRYTFGDTNRVKFIFVSYVPERIGGVRKAKVAGHKHEIAAFLKYFHVEINALSRDEISTEKLVAKLRAAGGADYGSGRGGGTSGGENFGGIKANAANFYAKTEKESKVEIVYQKGPLSTTPIDLSGRPMVASATEARKNTVDLM